MEFYKKYTEEIFNNISNNFVDNWDYLRYGPIQKPTLKKKIKNVFVKYLNSHSYYNSNILKTAFINIEKFKYLYDLLENDADKALLLKVLLYCRWGHTKVRLPLSTPEYWKKIEEIRQMGDSNSFLEPLPNFRLQHYNLSKIGFPINIFYTPVSIVTDFIIKQYEYKNDNGISIKAEKGDVVIDGGGCYGDTALYFANEVGNTGMVYSFEFVPENIEVFSKNVSINENLMKNIEIVKHPLWKDSTTKIFFRNDGAGTKVMMNRTSELDKECTTLSIDNLVKEKNINKVDFIKMDIEGAETAALIGASETIKKHKPKLAIALYHSEDDFEEIPKYLKNLVPDYKFYFSHCTMQYEESVLFVTL